MLNPSISISWKILFMNWALQSPPDPPFHNLPTPGGIATTRSDFWRFESCWSSSRSKSPSSVRSWTCTTMRWVLGGICFKNLQVKWICWAKSGWRTWGTHRKPWIIPWNLPLNRLNVILLRQQPIRGYCHVTFPSSLSNNEQLLELFQIPRIEPRLARLCLVNKQTSGTCIQHIA